MFLLINAFGPSRGHFYFSGLFGMDTLQKIKETMARYGMTRRGQTVLVAVSGGADSTVLLHALVRLREDLGISLVVCHLNHNLRGKESERDFDFVKRLAYRLGLPFEGERLKKGELEEGEGSLQERARERRIEFFKETAKKHGAKRAALGHTMDDNAETLLMRLLKGSSLSGLSGIAPQRGIFIRPLIGITRREVDSYAKVNGVDHITDSSNLTDKYLRNDVRHNLVPFIKERYNPNIVETLARTIEVLREDNSFIEAAAQNAFKSSVIEKRMGAVVLDRKALLSQHNAIASRVFLEALRSVKDVDASSSHVADFLGILKGRSPGASITLPGGLVALREYDKVSIERARPKKPHASAKTLKIPGVTAFGRGISLKTSVLDAPPASFREGPLVAYFDLDPIKAAGGITVRPFGHGDRMVPFGMKGHKKLKEIFIEKRVPRPLRQMIPVLVSAREVIWAAGVRQADINKVGPRTQKVLRVEVRGLEGI